MTGKQHLRRKAESEAVGSGAEAGLPRDLWADGGSHHQRGRGGNIHEDAEWMDAEGAGLP